MSLLYGVREIKSCSSEEEANELFAKKNGILLDVVPKNPNNAHIFLLGRLDKPLLFRSIPCEASDIQRCL